MLVLLLNRLMKNDDDDVDVAGVGDDAGLNDQIDTTMSLSHQMGPIIFVTVVLFLILYYIN